MEIVIKKGGLEHLDDCVEAIMSSKLGKFEFPVNGSAAKAVTEGIERGGLFVALEDGDCVGFIWYIPGGAFRIFPYINLISVKESHRGRGIGKKLIDFIENMAEQDKVFLVVGDFNPDAKRFYERIGYRQVGELPSLYQKGVNEYLMMKNDEKVDGQLTDN